jgi:hypothetical protein
LEFTRETVQLTPPAATSQQGKLLETLDEMDENDEFVQFSFQREEDHPFPISTTTLAQNNNNGGGGSERMEVVENNEKMCA